MLDKNGFDAWADSYEDSVDRDQEAGIYPFDGYGRVLGGIYQAVLRRAKGARVLDIGFGTGRLTQRLYQAGCTICGIDFSSAMLRAAREKMPEAELIEYDFTKGFPPELTGRLFDCIVSTYAFHHLPDGHKAPFLRLMLERLSPGGEILIGDVAFASRKALERCKEANASRWDKDESYLVFDDLKEDFSAARFEQVSSYAGIFRLEKL